MRNLASREKGLKIGEVDGMSGNAAKVASCIAANGLPTLLDHHVFEEQYCSRDEAKALGNP